MRAVLTFHGVDASGSVLSIHPDALRSLLRGIRAAGHAVVSLRELLERPAAPDRVALTFDDGLRSVHGAALPVLQEEGAVATLFLTTGHVGGENDWPGQPAVAPRFPMMDWDQVGALLRAGWEVQSHTVHHPDLRRLSDAEIRDELGGAARDLEERLGVRPDQLAYPYGAWDPRVRELARLSSRVQLTTELAPLDGRGPDDWSGRGIPRLDAYYLQAGWLQRRFGGALFGAWIAARALLRRWRNA